MRPGRADRGDPVMDGVLLGVMLAEGVLLLVMELLAVLEPVELRVLVLLAVTPAGREAVAVGVPVFVAVIDEEGVPLELGVVLMLAVLEPDAVLLGDWVGRNSVTR